MGGVMGKLRPPLTSVRQRRGGGQVHPDMYELEEPLLSSEATAGHDGAADGAPVEDAVPTEPLLGVPEPGRRTAEQAELPLHLGAVLRALSAAWHYLLGLLRRLLPGRYHAPPQLSPLEQDRLQQLRARAAVPYNAEAEEHQGALRGLWSVAFPDTPFPQGIKHPQWKEMGWQGDDPGTDFRGAGFISLEALLWMAQQREGTFRHLMLKQAGVRSSWEYPFAAGGVNVAFMLTEVLELRKAGGGAPDSRAARGFLPLLAQSDTAFEELFWLCMTLLDIIWLEKEATYMEFPLVLRDLRSRVEQCLARGRAGSFIELEQLLLPPGPVQLQQLAGQ